MPPTESTVFPVARDATGAESNALFAALTQVAPEWSPRVELVHLRAGQIIAENGISSESVHFPVSCVVSKLTVMEDGKAIEFATVGREGLAGATGLLTNAPMRVRIVCQVPGVAARVERGALSEMLQRNPAARSLVERYLLSLLVQVAQIAACNRVHQVEERCARWLLMTHDRVDGDEFLLTQEFLAQMLGVRRARVNVAAGILQRGGLIRYTRGRIRVTDRSGLERRACECYQVIRSEYDALAVSQAGEDVLTTSVPGFRP